MNFYPRSPCGERPPCSAHTTPSSRYFYPRSPCGERHANVDQLARENEFLSTLSLRRATELERSVGGHIQISIHALLAESDRWPS